MSLVKWIALYRSHRWILGKLRWTMYRMWLKKQEKWMLIFALEWLNYVLCWLPSEWLSKALEMKFIWNFKTFTTSLKVSRECTVTTEFYDFLFAFLENFVNKERIRDVETATTRIKCDERMSQNFWKNISMEFTLFFYAVTFIDVGTSQAVYSMQR